MESNVLDINTFRKLINDKKYEKSEQFQKIFDKIDDKNTSYLYANPLISLSNTQNTLQNKIFLYILMFITGGLINCPYDDIMNKEINSLESPPLSEPKVVLLFSYKHFSTTLYSNIIGAFCNLIQNYIMFDLAESGYTLIPKGKALTLDDSLEYAEKLVVNLIDTNYNAMTLAMNKIYSKLNSKQETTLQINDIETIIKELFTSISTQMITSLNTSDISTYTIDKSKITSMFNNDFEEYSQCRKALFSPYGLIFKSIMTNNNLSNPLYKSVTSYYDKTRTIQYDVTGDSISSFYSLLQLLIKNIVELQKKPNFETEVEPVRLLCMTCSITIQTICELTDFTELNQNLLAISTVDNAKNLTFVLLYADDSTKQDKGGMKGGVLPLSLLVPAGTAVGTYLPGIGTVMSTAYVNGVLTGITVNGWGMGTGGYMATTLMAYGTATTTSSPAGGPSAPVIALAGVAMLAVGYGLYSYYGSEPIALNVQTEVPTGEQTGVQTPGETNPGETNPGEATPGEATPGNATPGNTTPGNATPGNTTPGNTTPGNTTPGNTTPGNATPSEPQGLERIKGIKYGNDAKTHATTSRAEAKTLGLQQREDLKEGLRQADVAQKAATDYATTHRAEAKAQGLQRREDLKEGLRQADIAQKEATAHQKAERAKFTDLKQGLRQRDAAQKEATAHQKAEREKAHVKIAEFRAKEARIQEGFATFNTRVAEGTERLNNSLGAPPGAINKPFVHIQYPELSSVIILTNFTIKVFRKKMGYDVEDTRTTDDYKPSYTAVLPWRPDGVEERVIDGKTYLIFRKNINGREVYARAHIGKYYNYTRAMKKLADAINSSPNGDQWNGRFQQSELSLPKYTRLVKNDNGEEYLYDKPVYDKKGKIIHVKVASKVEDNGSSFIYSKALDILEEKIRKKYDSVKKTMRDLDENGNPYKLAAEYVAEDKDEWLPNNVVTEDKVKSGFFGIVEKEKFLVYNGNINGEDVSVSIKCNTENGEIKNPKYELEQLRLIILQQYPTWSGNWDWRERTGWVSNSTPSSDVATRIKINEIRNAAEEQISRNNRRLGLENIPDEESDDEADEEEVVADEAAAVADEAAVVANEPAALAEARGEANMPLDMTPLSNLQIFVKNNKFIQSLITEAKTNGDILAIKNYIESVYKNDIARMNTITPSLNLNTITPSSRTPAIWTSEQPINYPLNVPRKMTEYDPSTGQERGRGNRRQGQGQGQRQSQGQSQGQRQSQGYGQLIGGNKEKLLIADIQNTGKSNQEKLILLLETSCTPYIIKGKLYLLIDTDLLEKIPNLIKIISILESTIYIDTIKDIPLRLTMDKELYRKLVDFQRDCNKYLEQIPLEGGKTIKRGNTTKRNKKQKIHKKTKKQIKNKLRISKKKWNNKKDFKSSKKYRK